MTQFYQNLVTEKSWQILTSLKKEIDFVLIGGWAVFLYTKSLKSKDIDIIVDYSQLTKLEKLGQLFKNERLSKYELKKENIDIDIYLPHYSKIGIPIMDIQKETRSVETFMVPKPEMLLLTKLYALKQRRGSVKGIKDKIDGIALLLLYDFNFSYFKKLIEKYNLDDLKKDFIEILKSTTSVSELNLNPHKFSKARKTILNNL